MLNIDVYSIYTEKDERCGSDDELFSSFDEAMENRMRYANWWCPNGNVWIRRYPAGQRFVPAEAWHIDKDGSIMAHYDFTSRRANNG